MDLRIGHTFLSTLCDTGLTGESVKGSSFTFAGAPRLVQGNASLLARGGVNDSAACTGERVVVRSLSELENYTLRGDWANTTEIRSDVKKTTNKSGRDMRIGTDTISGDVRTPVRHRGQTTCHGRRNQKDVGPHVTRGAASGQVVVLTTRF